MLDCHFMFINKTVHEQVTTYNSILMNIFSIHIPHKFTIIDDKSRPR